MPPTRLDLARPNFPPGKVPGKPEFTDTYFDMSQGDEDRQDPWNSGGQWEVVSDRKRQAAVEGGDGQATVKLSRQEKQLLTNTAARTESRVEQII